MKASAWRALAVTLVLWSSGVPAQARQGQALPGVALGSVIHDLARKNGVLVPHLNALWPGGDQANTTLVLTDGAEVYEITGSMVKRLPDSALAEVRTQIDVNQPRSFQVVPSQRKAYYRFSLHLLPTQAAPPLIADALDEFLGFVYHEQFHFLVQPEWPRSPDTLNPDIYEDYPSDPLPRAYRRALAQSLRTALLSREPAGRQAALRQAAGLFTGWKTQYPDEVRRSRSTDLLEGTATYFEARLRLLAQGLDGDPAALGDRLDQITRVTPPGLRVEGYQLGALAGLLLDQVDPERQWTGEVQGGQTPVEVLLRRFPQPSQAPPAAVVEAVRTLAGQLESAVAPRLDPVIAGYEAGQPLLRVPGEIVGSFHVRGGFYRSARMPGWGLVTLSSIRVRTEAGEVEVKDVVWMQNLDQVEERGLTVLLDPTWVSEEGGVLTVRSPHFSRPLLATVKDEQGRTIYTAR
ncbi:hypothetical protein F8S09_15680 [Deinococcus sp. SDU3-2]|uniref:Peptidase M61 catalytic domain-containing protein n=1 Tax=Deinococcus terrestris TaxID=2651870 RepID=A0A7X1TT68_9DEIO|nr:hypothetical protein [Deinococcus terrestris]MPY68097.1 hypothetical protein [Deinococcus terrestris]